jgi:hypothetical protein
MSGNQLLPTRPRGPQEAAIPPGAVCVIPANVPHYVEAKEGDVIYYEAGVDVTEKTFLNHGSPENP